MELLKPLLAAILLLPLVASIIAGVLGKLLGSRITAIAVILLLAIGTCLSIYLCHGFAANNFAATDLVFYNWGILGATSLSIGCSLDQFTILMATLVGFVALMVHIYSVYYMADAEGRPRFFCYLAFFTFAMLVLVLASNLLQLFFAWEMVGLASYLLIGFYFSKEHAVTASFKAFIINRATDFSFILAILLIYSCTSSFNFSQILAQSYAIKAPDVTLFFGYTIPMQDLIGILLVIAALGKSAQIPFHTWLPDSMAGPLPVSALMHAATMVTAGIFMLARLSPLLEHSAVTMQLMSVCGITTCIAMGLMALVQYDIKQILAYSTISQLGLMLLALGHAAKLPAILHLFSHGFFKAALFLSAGTIILQHNNQQDLRHLHLAPKYMPFTYVVMLIASAAAVGIPATSGFYSKELILTAIESSGSSTPMYYLALLSVFITALYTWRMFFLLFHSKRAQATATLLLQKLPLLCKLPLLLLTIPSLIIGWYGVIAYRDGFLHKVLYLQTKVPDLGGALGMLLYSGMTLQFWLVVVAALVAWFCYPGSLKLQKIAMIIFAPINGLLKRGYGFNILNNAIVTLVRAVGRQCRLLFEELLIEKIILGSTIRIIVAVANKSRQMQTGYIYHYIFIMLLGLAAMLAYLLLASMGLL